MGILDLFFKAPCLLCKKQVNNAYLSICDRCFDNISVLSPLSSCPHCHKPVYSNFSDTPCDECSKYRKNDAIQRNYSAATYEGNVKQLLFKLKFEGRREIAQPLAYLLHKYIRDNKLKLSVDYLVPIPISGKRLQERGYNQALLIATELAKIEKFRVHDTLIRHKATEHLHNQGINDRKSALSEAFSVNESVNIRGKDILILDDIFTTGTTVNECAKVLLSRGAGSVSSLTVARTVF